MPQSLEIEQFLQLSKGSHILDVRSPQEFAQGHIPGASGLPLFSDEERAAIGTIYKQRNRQEAVMKGLELVAPRMQDLVAKGAEKARENTLFVHCWRGGMRSGFVAMLLEMYGIKVFTLKGGYKAFRNHILHLFTRTYPLLVLGGRTGSGKTRVLQKLAEQGEQVIDLEALAHHKGSAFGALGEPGQPSQEQFENRLGLLLAEADQTRPLWLEDESRLIGKKVIPPGLWEQMRSCRVYYLQLPFEERLKYICEHYGKYPAEDIRQSILKISRRMGPEQTKNALHSLDAGDLHGAFSWCLQYYDKTYSHGLSQRDAAMVEEMNFDKMDLEEMCKRLLHKVRAHG